MNPAETVESTMQKFVFDFLDRFGASLTIVAILLILTWRVFPKLSEVLIDKYRAETELVRETQKVVATFPTLVQELKTALIATLTEHRVSIEKSIGEGTDKRIETKVESIARRVSSLPGTTPDSEPPSRASFASRPG
jgi:hypothetical protein